MQPAAGRSIQTALRPALVSTVRVVPRGVVHTVLGLALRVTIEREDGAPMGWRELWEAFAASYPDRYAVQLLPPRRTMADQTNRYWLHVLDAAPAGLDVIAGDR